MKKQLHLILVTIVFGAFTLGFFLGRNSVHGPVEVSILQQTAFGRREEVTEGASLPSAAPVLAPTESVYDLQVGDAELKPEGTSPPDAEVPAGPQWPIDLNTAGSTQLMALPGVGEVLAGRIIEYREQYGGFQTVEELLNVRGIGEKKLEALAGYVTVGG